MRLAEAVHKAVHDELASSGHAELFAAVAGRIYDRIPINLPATYPYLVFDIDIRDDATECSNASEVHVTVHVYSNAQGTIEAKQIGGMVREILAPDDAGINLAFDGFLTSVSAFDLELYRPADTPMVTEGVLTFTFLVDPDD